MLIGAQLNGQYLLNSVKNNEELLKRLMLRELTKLTILTTNEDTKNQTLINSNCVCGALNLQFCESRVFRYFSVVNLFCYF
jgi:hypothetical protein